MKTFVAVLVAYLAAVAIPTLFVAIFSDSLLAAALVGAFGAFYALVVGVPIFLVLNKFGLITWWTGLIAGFVAVAAFDAFPILQHWQYMASEGYLDVMIKSAITKGLYGAAGGFTFWLVWRKLMPPNKALQG